MCTMGPLACINGGEFLQKGKALHTSRKALHTSPHCLFNMMGKSPSRSKGTYTLHLRPWGSSLGPRCKMPSSKGLLPYTNIRDIICVVYVDLGTCLVNKGCVKVCGLAILHLKKVSY
jgi:hypothetical protein